MTDFYWVRHGPTHEKNFVGWRDVPADLSDTALIDRVADHLPEDGVVVSSDLDRCVKTADAIQKSRTRLAHEFNLREFDFGDWDGKHWSAVAKTHPDLSRQFWEAPGDIQAPNGESWNFAANRAQGIVDRLATDHQVIIAVAHFGIILTQVQRALGCTPYQALSHKIDNLSVTHLRCVDGVWSAPQINHLV